MIDFSNLLLGFQVALSMENLVYCFIGVLLGTFIGVLPGLGPVVTIGLLLPITFSLPPVASLIMLAGIYYGASYGGSTTAILVNLPGESSSVVTAIDGYAMARKGRAGAALAIAAIGSFAAGTISTLLVALLSPVLSTWAISFQSPEYFSLMLLGLIAAAALSNGPMLKAFAMVPLGLLLGIIGTDPNTSVGRFTFGIRELSDGLDFVVVALGLFGLSEIILNLNERQGRDIFPVKVSNLMLNREDLRRSWKPILRGTALGSVLGILPGAGATIATFAAYALEKRVSPRPEEFGSGAIEGVAGPESANNAAAQTAFIPTLTLGLPGSPTMALMLGAMIMFGITPGPQVMTSHPDLFWGLIASMWVGNLMLLALNLPLVGLWVKILKVPYEWLFPAIVLLSCVGAFTVSRNSFDIWILALVGLLGFAMARVRFPPAPLMLGFILGPMLEENLRRSLMVSRGSFSIFIEKPISAALLLCALALLVLMLAPTMQRKRNEVIAAEDPR
jgi:putative tricarboxylic transport membrane protein